MISVPQRYFNPCNKGQQPPPILQDFAISFNMNGGRNRSLVSLAGPGFANDPLTGSGVPSRGPDVTAAAGRGAADGGCTGAEHGAVARRPRSRRRARPTKAGSGAGGRRPCREGPLGRDATRGSERRAHSAVRAGSWASRPVPGRRIPTPGAVCGGQFRPLRMPGRADRPSGGRVLMDRGRDGRRGQGHGAGTGQGRGLAPALAGSGRPPSGGLPLLLAPLGAELAQVGRAFVPLLPRLGADPLHPDAASRPATGELVHGPGHDVVRDVHVPLDDPRLLDVGARGPHGHVIAPDDVLPAHPRDPAGIAAECSRTRRT